MLKNVTLVEERGSNKYVAPDGKVITNYKEGDSQIVFSKSLIFAKSASVPENFYLMDEEEAKTIKAKFDEEQKKMDEIHHRDELDGEEPIEEVTE